MSDNKLLAIMCVSLSVVTLIGMICDAVLAYFNCK